MDKKMTIQIPTIDLAKYLKEFPKIKRKRGRINDNIKSPLLKHQIIDEKIEKELLTSLPSL